MSRVNRHNLRCIKGSRAEDPTAELDLVHSLLWERWLYLRPDFLDLSVRVHENRPPPPGLAENHVVEGLLRVSEEVVTIPKKGLPRI